MVGKCNKYVSKSMLLYKNDGEKEKQDRVLCQCCLLKKKMPVRIGIFVGKKKFKKKDVSRTKFFANAIISCGRILYRHEYCYLL